MVDYEGTTRRIAALSDDEIYRTLAVIEVQTREQLLLAHCTPVYIRSVEDALYQLNDQAMLHHRELSWRGICRLLAAKTVDMRNAPIGTAGNRGYVHVGHSGPATGEHDYPEYSAPGGHLGHRATARPDSRRPYDRSGARHAVDNNHQPDAMAWNFPLPQNYDFTFQCRAQAACTEDASGSSSVLLPPPLTAASVRGPAEPSHHAVGSGQVSRQTESNNRGVKRAGREEPEDDHRNTHLREKKRRVYDKEPKAGKGRRHAVERGHAGRSVGALVRPAPTSTERRIQAWRVSVASAGAVDPFTPPSAPSSPAAPANPRAACRSFLPF